ncbi:hypothetical protein PC128_g21851 [Phytophthora cactorum]|nr:hypothetical protein PC128_g21851 [Phytophthora cactorum]
MGALREQVTRQDDEVRQDEEVRQQRLRGARTRSEKSRSLAQAEGGRERAPANEKIENCPSQEGKLDLKEETHEKVREGEEGTNEGGPSVRQERIDDVSIPAEAAKKQPGERRHARQKRSAWLLMSKEMSWSTFLQSCRPITRPARSLTPS